MSDEQLDSAEIPFETERRLARDPDPRPSTPALDASSRGVALSVLWWIDEEPVEGR